MKKLFVVLLLALTLALLIACSDAVTTAVGCPDTTDAPDTTTTEAASTTSVPNTDEEDEPTIIDGEIIEKTHYVATKNAAKTDKIESLAEYDLTCSSGTLMTEINSRYKAYTSKTYVIVDADGKETSYTSATQATAAAKKAGRLCGVMAELDDEAMSAVFKVYLIDERAVVIPSWTQVTSKAGYYLMFDFTTNVDVDFCVTVTKKAGQDKASASYTQAGISVEAIEDGSGRYVGVARCTIPYEKNKTFYINICLDESPYTTFVSIPVTTTEPIYDTPFRFTLIGDWHNIKEETIIERIYTYLYDVYPRIYARWAYLGTEYTDLSIECTNDLSKDNWLGECLNNKIKIRETWLQSDIRHISTLSHEMTHCVQRGMMFYGDGSGGWFIEAMSDYSRFRYFNWGSNDDRYTMFFDYNDEDTFDYHKNGDESKVWDGYGNTEIFFAYLDWMWPTTDKNGDGEITPDEHGLLDHLIYESKHHTGAKVSDDPHTVGSIFNNWVKEITGIDTLDLVRLQFVDDAKSGAWVFTGYENYRDNFLTENICGMPDQTYLRIGALTPTAKTHPLLAAAMTVGDNLCLGARVTKVSATSVDSSLADYLTDGKLDTGYESKGSTYIQQLWQIDNEIVIDLGDVKTFDTYTFVFYGADSSQYARSWEILVSGDGESYTAIDYQSGNDSETVSVRFDEVSARYVKIHLYESDASSGYTRISEFMLFDLNK